MPPTPAPDDPQVLDFCRGIRPDQQPALVPVQTIAGALWGECFSNVARMVEQSGGSPLRGWAVWKKPGLFIEAESHAVWVSPDGTRIDVSPHVGRTQVLFLPDPGERPTAPVPNVRRPLTDDPRMIEYIRLADRNDALRLANFRLHGRPVRTAENLLIGQQMARLQRELGMLPAPDEVAEAMELAKQAIGQMMRGSAPAHSGNARLRADTRKRDRRKRKKKGR